MHSLRPCGNVSVLKALSKSFLLHHIMQFLRETLLDNAADKSAGSLGFRIVISKGFHEAKTRMPLELLGVFAGKKTILE